MYEDLIRLLEELGVDFTENEDGSITVSIADVDKMDLIDIITFLNDNNMEYNLDENSIEVYTAGAPEEELELEEPELPPLPELDTPDFGGMM